MQGQINLISIMKCIQKCIFEVLFALIHLKKKWSFANVLCANMQYLDSLKLSLKTKQVWKKDVPSDVLIEDFMSDSRDLLITQHI